MELLSTIGSRAREPENELTISPAFDQTLSTEEVPEFHTPLDVRSSDDALNALTSKPNFENLAATLKWLQSTSTSENDFNILKPSPKAAQIVFSLVDEAIPNYWALLQDQRSTKSRKTRTNLLICLSSTTGCGAIVSRLRSLLDGFIHRRKGGTDVVASSQPLETLVEILEAILQSDRFLEGLLKSARVFYDSQTARSGLLWREAVSLFGSGRLLTLVAEVNLALNEVSKEVRDGSWIGRGDQYAAWLGRNLGLMMEGLGHDEGLRLNYEAQLMSKALSLGYTDHVVENAFSRLLLGNQSSLGSSRALLLHVSPYEQRSLLYSLIRVLSKKQSKGSKVVLGASAALLSGLLGEDASLQEHLANWLVSTSPEAIGHSHTMHRTAVLALSTHKARLQNTLWKALDLFSDKLYIRHSPILHQEVNAQILLTLAGYAYRADKSSLTALSKSSVYLKAISNHLAASSTKSRSLGMVVGSSISDLLDEPGKRLQFGPEDSKDIDWSFYKTLLGIKDKMGNIVDLQTDFESSKIPTGTLTKASTIRNGTSNRRKVPASSKVVKIEEIYSESGSESEDDLPIYAKPDSDPSDDEDPELVVRNKPTAPVYIRDLLAGLRDTENFDRHTLALKAAPSLIRRKANYGTEVSDHIEDLASTILGLKDRWEAPDFSKLRLQGMLSLLIASPLEMGQYFSRAFYSGDYSLGQRISILTTLGLGAREIAGAGGNDDIAITGAPPPSERASSSSSFPSKRLPERAHAHYAAVEAAAAAPLNSLTTQLSRTMIAPLAASAADQLSGPAVLKVRGTFSSRMEVEARRAAPAANPLSRIIGEAFFYPLIGRWAVQIQSFAGAGASGNNGPPQASPTVLAHLLKTLGMVLHAAGPFTVALPSLTREFWGFLLGLRARAEDDRAVLEGLLFALLTLMDVNSEGEGRRRVAEEQARELLETQEWVGGVLDRVRGGEEEGERCRMLAAGVLVRCREVVERFQRLMMRDMIDFMPG